MNRRKLFWIFMIAVILADLGLHQLIIRNNEQLLPKREAMVNEEELIYFPLAVCADSGNGKETDLTWSFVDTWNQSRNYGGDRVHEGCDIMTSQNLSGVYPVISISDGVVEKMGWLELGGYRIGIRTASGTYLYYAHLESYFPGIEEGMAVCAGECLGYVGDTGYGPEGTHGKFAAHLHIGFYLPDENGEDVALNPYPYLLKLQDQTLKYEYEDPNETGEN